MLGKATKVVGVGLCCALGLSACGAESSAPTASTPAAPAADVSLVFQDNAGDVTVDDAALTLAVVVLPEAPERLSDLATVASLLLGESGAIEATELTGRPDATCADLLGPDGLGIEDVAALFALDTAATSPNEFDARLATLLPADQFQQNTLPTVEDLEQCAVASIPVVRDLTLNKMDFMLGENVAISALADSATGFTSFEIGVVAEVNLIFFRETIDIIEPQTFEPQQADANCVPNETAQCTPSVLLTLPEDVDLPGNAVGISYFVEFSASEASGEMGSARIPFTIQ